MADKIIIKVPDNEPLTVEMLCKELIKLVNKGKGNYSVSIDTDSKEFKANVVYLDDAGKDILIGFIS